MIPFTVGWSNPLSRLGYHGLSLLGPEHVSARFLNDTLLFPLYFATYFFFLSPPYCAMAIKINLDAVLHLPSPLGSFPFVVTLLPLCFFVRFLVRTALLGGRCLSSVFVFSSDASPSISTGRAGFLFLSRKDIHDSGGHLGFSFSPPPCSFFFFDFFL